MPSAQVLRYESALSRSQSRYSDMISEMRSALETEKGVPSEYQQVADIYKTGGEYGLGARARIEAERQKGVATAQAGLVSTGMSSGSMAVGVGQRYSRAAGQAIQGVEDIRYERLGTALTALAAAKESRGQRVSNIYATTASLIGGFREPSTSEFASQEDISAAGEKAATQRTWMGIQASKEKPQQSVSEDLPYASELRKQKYTSPDVKGLTV